MTAQKEIASRYVMLLHAAAFDVKLAQRFSRLLSQGFKEAKGRSFEELLTCMLDLRVIAQLGNIPASIVASSGAAYLLCLFVRAAHHPDFLLPSRLSSGAQHAPPAPFPFAH